jgi:Skp family chaperone for outer membrane proteins
MLSDQKGRGLHDKFKELCALAISGSLAPVELCELRDHLQHCEECHEVFLQYRTLTTEGMAALADAYVERQEQATWDDTRTRHRLLARVRADQQVPLERKSQAPAAVQPSLLSRAAAKPFAQMALAACLILTVGFGAYRLGLRAHSRTAANVPPVSVDDRFQKLSDQKKDADELLAAQSKKLAQLQEESAEKEQELAKLRLALRALEDRARELTTATSQSEGQLRALSQQRDSLNAQLQAAAQAYQNDRTELASLRAERDKTLLRTNSLEAKADELLAKNRDQERRLKASEQYLASDRDIRELMGARKLYIADVFDVDSSSHTQKPYGRVFYTQGKSLIFYAFDLDREPGVVNASAFQVWGQREAPQGEPALPMNLGILYMDNETNRRWVMRLDDPKQLAEIDAVFVTVEPRGGSNKPTGKPFLYALLRNEANHP